MTLQDRVAVVTGGTCGVGGGVARALAAELDRAFPGRWSALRQPNGARSFQRARELWAGLASICDCFAPARNATQGS